MDQKLTALLFSLALSFGAFSAHAGLGADQPPGGAPPAQEAPDAEDFDADRGRAAPGTDEAPGAPGGAPGTPPSAELGTTEDIEDVEFSDLDRDGEGRLSRADVAAHECLMEAWDEVVDDTQEGMTEDEFEQAKEEYC